MPTLVYLSGWTSTTSQTDISMLESTPSEEEILDEDTKMRSNNSSVKSQKRARTKKVPNKRKYGGVQGAKHII